MSTTKKTATKKATQAKTKAPADQGSASPEDAPEDGNVGLDTTNPTQIVVSNAEAFARGVNYATDRLATAIITRLTDNNRAHPQAAKYEAAIKEAVTAVRSSVNQ